MKVLAVVEQFAGKAMIRIGGYGREGFFFSGKQPDVPSMIAVEIEGLKGHSEKSVREWLNAFHAKATGDADSEHADLVEEHWRRAVLDDVLDAVNGTDLIWYISRFFTLAEIATFAEAHGPKLDAEIRAALDVERKKRATALRKVEKRSARILPVIYAGSSRISVEAMELETAFDQERIAAVMKTRFHPATWIEAAASLHTDQGKRDLMDIIGGLLVDTGADIGAALDLMIAAKLDRIHAPMLFAKIQNHVVLPQNVTDEVIDLTKAREHTVTFTFDTWKARRVGPIKIGRTALVVYDGNKLTYVRGERKLLHRLREKGGTMSRWGNLLGVGMAKTSAASVHGKLLEVDRIDTLAQVDPRAAAKLAGESLPAADPISTALENSQGDPTWRRILADLLIERLVGIDSDVARRLARQQQRANRR
ncbi:MAG TPA: hypothetical protein VL326_17900 [Kofleriaceae bacterium]|nr:hypothetical protein [Kofleriaceae bacterium]